MVKNNPVSCIDGAINGGINDKELDILSILDFPLESLGGDELAEDWDVSKFQCLEPIPSDLLGSSLLPQNQIRPPFLSHLPIVPANQSAEASNPLHRHMRADPSQSPVSVLLLCNTSQIRRAARSKRAKPSRNSWSSTLPVVIPSPSTTSKKTPGRAVKNASSSSSSKRHKNSNQPSSSIDNGSSSFNPNDFVKVCSHCQSTETPQWREGPMGPQTLCNACGVRYRTGRLFPEYRPANSPTFVPSVHSNCHKKVMEMRSRARRIHH